MKVVPVGIHFACRPDRTESRSGLVSARGKISSSPYIGGGKRGDVGLVEPVAPYADVGLGEVVLGWCTSASAMVESMYPTCDGVVA